jgi:hypothetical protein
VVIQNRGGETLTQLTINYGPQGKQQSFDWSGELAFMEKEEVRLAAFDWEDWQAGEGRFRVEVSNPNGSADENPGNDVYWTKYDLPIVYPGTFVVHFMTNKAASQNHYEFLSNDGDQIWEKKDFENTTLYIDTISFVNGCYDFYLYDSGDNGIDFWAEPEEGKGYLRFYDLNGHMIQHFEGDFGNEIYKSFYTDISLGTLENVDKELAFNVIPNPNNGRFIISYALEDETEIKMEVFNSAGQQVWLHKETAGKQGKINVNLNALPSGIYSCVLTAGQNVSSRKFVLKK